MKVVITKVKTLANTINKGDIIRYRGKRYTVIDISLNCLSAVERCPDSARVRDLKEPIHLDFVIIPIDQIAVSVQTRIRPELKYESEPAADLESTPETAADSESTSEEVPEQ